MFNANVFSVLALRIESKIIIFTSELLQGFRFFSSKFCIPLRFSLENGKAGLKVQLPLTSGAI